MKTQHGERVLKGLEAELTETAVVEKAVEMATGRFVSVPMTATKQAPYYYEDGVWVPDMEQRVYGFAGAVIDDIEERAGRLLGRLDDKQRSFVKSRIRRFKTIQFHNELANAIPRRLAVPRDAMNRDPWLLNLENGTYDLRNDELRPHDPADMMSAKAPAAYNPSATAPTFYEVLERIMPDSEMREYLQILFGHALNGSMQESVAPLLVGRGQNGKTTLVEAIRATLGPGYTASVPGDVLVRSTNEKHPASLMEFRDKRLAFASETQEDMPLDEARVKQLSSREPIQARKLHEQFIEFVPTHTLFIQTNHKPTVRGGDRGIWRRLQEVPFEQTITRRDPDIGDKLSAERDGILRWLIEGHRLWMQQGRLSPPQRVIDRTRQYEMDSNPLQTFFEDTFELAPDGFVSSRQIFVKYQTWATMEGMRNQMSQPQLIPKIRDQFGLTQAREFGRSGPRGLAGIKVKSGGPAPEPTRPLPEVPEGDEIYLDLETTGLHPVKERARLMVASDGRDPLTFDLFDAVGRADALAWLAARKTKTMVGANIQFDLEFLEADLGYKHEGAIFDVVQASRMIHGGVDPTPAPPWVVRITKAGKEVLKKDTPHSLRSLVYRYLEKTLDKSQQVSDWAAADLTDQQLEYAKEDVRVLPGLLEAIRPNAGEDYAVQLTMDNIKAAASMRVRGIRIDEAQWIRTAETHEEALSAVDSKLDELAGEPGNWNSVQQITALLKKHGVRVPNTQRDTLSKYDHPIAKLLVERAEHKKGATTYGKAFLETHAVDGRIHAQFKVGGARTSRYSSSNPNMQNIPRDPAYRQAFIPDEGCKFVIADWSQIEVRYVAAIAEDEALREAVGTGDVYSATARSVLGIEPDAPVSKEQRRLAKALVLGLIYGMGAVKLRESAAVSYGVHMTSEEAVEYRNRFFEAYPQLRRWQQDQGQPDWEGDQEGYDVMTTYWGTVRRGVEKFNQRVNTPVQAAAADAMRLALSRMSAAGLDLVLTVHDEAVVSAPEASAEEVKAQVVEIMEQAAWDALRPGIQIPVPVEAAVGDSWADKA